MKRLNDNECILTQSEIDTMYEYIRDKLYQDWDHYTNHFICSDSTEDGMKRMNEFMYDFANQLNRL